MMLEILYVDDEEILRDVSKLTLESNAKDIHVTTFSSPKEALTHLKTNNPDVIVSDFAMVPEDGISFLIKVRQIHDGLPFILFTGRGKEEIVIQALNEGADFYLQKSGDAKSLYAELEHMIRKAIERRTNEKTILKLKASLLVLPGGK